MSNVQYIVTEPGMLKIGGASNGAITVIDADGNEVTGVITRGREQGEDGEMVHKVFLVKDMHFPVTISIAGVW